ncbi:MAG: peptidoglycan DD-metalloendopeptidase family protein [Actinobacteria bacterium]|nr:peptidoglycan DD-metalloendopeptidase family protein [Actinomycetota bacterium]
MPRSPLARPTAFVVALALCLVVPGGAVAQTGNEKAALAEAKARIEAVKARIGSAQAEARTAATELADADARLAEVEAAVNDAAAALERQELAVAEAENALGRLEADRRRIRDAFDRRAAGIYKRGSGLSFEIVLTSGNVQDALERSAFLRVITSADQATLEGVETSQVAVEAQRRLLEAEQQTLEAMYVEQQELLDEVARLRASKALEAASARAEVQQLESEKETLEADSEALERIIEIRAAAGTRVSSPSTAGYSWPLCGPVTSEYGRRWGRMHSGMDIDDSWSRTIMAAKDGVVIFAGWQGGYGRLTLIDHGGVVTAYAHQSGQSVSAGQVVSRGQRIGTVGNTGNSTGPHLHFETRVNGGAVNPRRFLPGGGC